MVLLLMRFFPVLILLATLSLGWAQKYEPVDETPPAIPREFRGVWLASVWNLDWPTSSRHSPAKQRKELIAILDRAVELKLNAVVLQVRPAGDAFYRSELEPWSPFLTGMMGKAPSEDWDPLEFAIREAHRRGLHLHAWVNPFRAGTSFNGGYLSKNHIGVKRPDLLVRYGKLLWLDPSEPDAVEHVMRVILDIVTRYDIDGFHIDDYFYPYPKWEDGKQLSFDDNRQWLAYQAGGGALSRGDWRRGHINRFVERMYREIKAIKPWVRVGISPFGIWRPGIPEGTTAKLDAYHDLHADALLWWRAGWLDYLSPQLYWDIESEGQAFPKLLKWWHDENRKQRHLWPGVAGDRVPKKRPAEELENQIELIRSSKQGDGFVLWSWRSVGNNQGGLASLLEKGALSHQAAVPASPWLGDSKLPAPEVKASKWRRGWSLTCKSTAPGGRGWVVQWQNSDGWETRILPSEQRKFSGSSEAPMAIVVRGLDRLDNAGAATILRMVMPGG